MSFSSNGVTFNRTKWIRNRIFKFLFKGAEGILSILFVISLAAPMIFPKDVNAALGVSSKLSYQGRLTDASGNPYTGTYYVCFSIFDAVSAGTKLWPTAVPANNTVAVTNGVFDVGVGVADALNFDFSTNDTVYLNVGVSASNVACDNGAMENLTPRQRMDATPYARVAANVWGTALRTNATSTSIGAGSGAATPIWLNLDWKNTATTLGGACPSGSVNGSVWYNSSGTRALACINNIVVGIDNASEITGIKEQSAGSPITAGAVNFSGSNNITISQTGSTLQFSVPTPVQGFGMSNIGNTLGTSGSGTGTIVLAGGNNITLSQATGAGARTITIIGPAAGGGAALQGSGTYSQNTGTVQFGNSNGITFGLSNNGTMTASHNGLTVQSAQPVAISGSNGSFAFSTVSFGNLNGLSFYTSNGSIVGSYTAGGGGGVAIAGGASTATNGTVIFSNSPTVSFGLNNGTMTASAAGGGGAAPAIRFVEGNIRQSISNITNITALTGRPIFVPFYVGGNLTASRIMIEMSRSTSGSNLFSIHAGFYSFANNTQLSLIGSWSNSYSNTATASVSGIRQFHITGVPAGASTLPSGNYILALEFTAAATASMNYSIRGGITAGPPVGQIAPGANSYSTATSHGMFPFFGRYSTTVAALPNSIGASQVIAGFSGASTPVGVWFGIRAD